MPAPTPFALYRKSQLAEPVGAALDIELRYPVVSAGVTVFRSSLWLPLPEACRSATALSLDGSTLQAQFRPAEFALETEDARWFDLAEDDGEAETRLELVWPAPIVRIDDPFPGLTLEFGLHRADGEAVSAEAAQNGTTGVPLEVVPVGGPGEAEGEVVGVGVDADQDGNGLTGCGECAGGATQHLVDEQYDGTGG